MSPPEPSAPIGQPPAVVRTWFDGLAVAARPDSDGSLDAAQASAKAYRSRAKADNTRATYRSAIRMWCLWCDRHGRSPLPAPADLVAAFIADERNRGRSRNTIAVRLAALRYLHRAAGLPSPTATAEVSETMAGIRREAAGPTKKRAATLAVLRELIGSIPDDLRGLRDRALLLVSFAGALRRSELARIQVRELERTDRGFQVTLPRSKGSQTAAVVVPIPYGKTELCPVCALSRWMAAAGIGEGAVFRRLWVPPAEPKEAKARYVVGTESLAPRSIARIVQARAAAAGFQATEFGGHSLKRGALTTGKDLGVHPALLKRLGRQTTFDVLGEYLKFGDLFSNHPLRNAL